MARQFGTWWIKSGMDERRDEARSFGDVLEHVPSMYWTEDHGEGDVVKKDFVKTPGYAERVDKVDGLYMSSHGSYNPDDEPTWGHAFCTYDGVVQASDAIEWGHSDLEFFASHACKLLYHSATNSVGRWIPAFSRLHYMFGFHTVSNSGKDQEDRGGKFATYAAFHLFFPPGMPWFAASYPIRTAWKKACIETEDSSVQWAYLRANGRTTGGTWVDTYDERLEVAEPNDPVNDREFYTCRGSC